MKTAIIHDWLSAYAGAEKVLERIYEIYASEIYTLIYEPKYYKNSVISKAVVNTSCLQRLPFGLGVKHYRNFLPFFPYLVEQYDLSGYDVVLSSSHAAARGVITRHDQLHITYCHSPIRYAWDLYHQYMKEAGLTGLKGLIAGAFLHYIRLWDAAAAGRPDYYIANSKYISARIKKIYGREAAVIYPPVDVDKFNVCPEKGNYYFTCSRMVPYKKIDMIVEAFSELKLPLVVVGDGPDMKKIKKSAGRNVELVGYQPDNVLVDYMKKARAFVFAAEEDFGIVPVEAQACGTPVIAFGKGGALETVVDGETGIFFDEQTVGSLVAAVKKFESDFLKRFDPGAARKQAEKFSVGRFKNEYREFVEAKMSEKFNAGKVSKTP